MRGAAQEHRKQLPNCVTVAAAWDPAACRSAALLAPTEWPETRAAQVQLDLELAALPGQTASIRPELRFLVRGLLCPHRGAERFLSGGAHAFAAWRSPSGASLARAPL